MNLFRALFRRVDRNIGASAPSPVSDPIDTDDDALITDDVPRGIGDRPNITGRILCEPSAPSKAQIAQDRRQLDGAASETSPTPGRGPKLMDAETNARKLISVMIGWGLGGHSVPYAYMVEYHREMCRRLAWQPGPWNPVAAELRRLTGGRKTYAWFKLEDGRPHRLRVYEIPHRMRTERFAEGRVDIPETRSAA
jgi:hypothetical protein